MLPAGLLPDGYMGKAKGFWESFSQHVRLFQDLRYLPLNQKQ